VFHSLCFTEEVVVELQNNCVADDVACSLTFENAASILFLIATLWLQNSVHCMQHGCSYNINALEIFERFGASSGD